MLSSLIDCTRNGIAFTWQQWCRSANDLDLFLNEERLPIDTVFATEKVQTRVGTIGCRRKENGSRSLGIWLGREVSFYHKP
jgi:hypothetical protein